MDNPYKPARKLVEHFPTKAAELIAKHYEQLEIEKILRIDCELNERDYFAVMSGQDNGAATHLLQPLPADKLASPLTPAPSSQGSFSPASTSRRRKQNISPDGPEMIRVYGAHESKLLSIERVSTSYNLIGEDVVRKRLQLEPELLGGSREIAYNQGQVPISQQIALTWIASDSDKTHEDTFLVLSIPMKSDIVLGDSRSQSGTEQWIREARISRSPGAGNSGIAQPFAQRQSSHIRGFTEAHSNHYSSIDDEFDPPSPVTVRATSRPSFANRTGVGYGQPCSPSTLEAAANISGRRMSNSSQLPRRSPPSGHSSGSPTLSQAYPPHRPSHGASATTSPLSQNVTGSEEAWVELSWGEDSVTVALNLHDSGEAFLRTLTESFDSFELQLDRNANYVMFSATKDAGKACRYSVYLKVHEIGKQWENAKRWIISNTEQTPGGRSLSASIKKRGAG
ncbi:MAG: hypothetical protein M1821_008580 [Bathelium mastoideum]|nr:MAG: hypothetical protein M1821_008580 [Bathelium mastoideum]